MSKNNYWFLNWFQLTKNVNKLIKHDPLNCSSVYCKELNFIAKQSVLLNLKRSQLGGDEDSSGHKPKRSWS